MSQHAPAAIEPRCHVCRDKHVPEPPHLADELWARTGHETPPAFRAAACMGAPGARRGHRHDRRAAQRPAAQHRPGPARAGETVLRGAAREAVTKHLGGPEVRREAVVPGRLADVVLG